MAEQASRASRVLVSRPLARLLAGFELKLGEAGYTPMSAKRARARNVSNVSNAVNRAATRMLRCTDCGDTKAEAAFLAVRGTSYFYGRCRACRAGRPRERYHSTPEIRAAEIARL